jgi:hypothetical protein
MDTVTFFLHSYHQQIFGNDCVPAAVFKYQEDVLRYLDKTGTLTRLQEAANKYRKYIKRLQRDHDQRVPFLFLLQLDIIQLAEISGKRRQKYKQLEGFL